MINPEIGKVLGHPCTRTRGRHTVTRRVHGGWFRPSLNEQGRSCPFEDLSCLSEASSLVFPPQGCSDPRIEQAEIFQANPQSRLFGSSLWQEASPVCG